MTSDRIKEIQKTTAYPESISVKQALLQVWNECEQKHNNKAKQKTQNELREIIQNEYNKQTTDTNYNFINRFAKAVFDALNEPKTMTKAEAIEEMKKGNKVTHRHFTDDEWVTMGTNGKMVLEDGVELPPHEFWKWRTDESFNTDWSIYSPHTGALAGN